MKSQAILFLLVIQWSSFAVFTIAENETATPKTNPDLDWWQTAVLYQIYPRSFKDTDGDGIGDLNGISEGIEYLKDLGVTAVWISPIYKSPMVDFGYDISDYRAIEQIFGTMQDFIKLKDKIHSHGLKLLLDLVPNHTSDEHEWFQKSVENIEPYSDFYVWHEGRFVNGTRHPPNNWLSYFEGSVWTWNEMRQKYYLHQYHYKQPDLNYRCPNVMQEIKNVMRFWLDMGVDGFRVDSVNTLLEDDQFLDEPRSFMPDVPSTSRKYLNHIYTADQPGSYDKLNEMRRFLDEYSLKESTLESPSEGDESSTDSGNRGRGSNTKVMFTEAYSSLVDTMRYYGNATHPIAHFTFNFFFITDLNAQSSAMDFQRVFDLWYSNMPQGNWANWVLGNHDNQRLATRYTPEFASSILMMQFLLPGTTVTYMGEEIGMEDTFIRWDETVDPQGLKVGKSRYLQVSRDGTRAPFLWDDTWNAGFSNGSRTWLPVNPNFWNKNMKIQQNQQKSHLNIYKKLLKLKSTPVILFGDLNVKTASKTILIIERVYKNVSVIAVVNVDSQAKVFDLSPHLSVPVEILTVYESSLNSKYVEGAKVPLDKIILNPKEGIVFIDYRSDGPKPEKIEDLYRQIKEVQ